MFNYVPTTLGKLMSEYRNRDAQIPIIIPEIQREYKWTLQQVISYLTAIYNHAPTGIFVLWETEDDPWPVKGGIDWETEFQGRKKFVIDGQQRLESLARVKQSSGETNIDIWYDVTHEEEDDAFVLSDRSRTDYENLVLLSDIWADFGRVVRDYLAKYPEAEADTIINKLSKVNDMLKYDIRYINIEENADAGVVTDIFEELNRAGTKLRGTEIIIAHLANAFPGSVTKGLSDFQDELGRKSYYDFTIPFLGQCFTAVSLGFVYNRKNRIKKALKEKAGDTEFFEYNWGLTKKSINDSLDIIRGYLGITPENRFGLPLLFTKLPFIVLVKYLALVNNKVLKSTDEVKYWFALAMYFRRYGSSALTRVDQDLGILTDSELDNPVNELFDKLMRYIGRESLEITETDVYNNYNKDGALMLLYAVCRLGGAESLLKGGLIDFNYVGSRAKPEFHHIFPRAFLKRSGITDKFLVNHIGNICFLSHDDNMYVMDKEPLVYFEEVKRSSKERLEAQFIPTDEELWKVERYEEFLKARVKLITKAINDLVGQESTGELRK